MMRGAGYGPGPGAGAGAGGMMRGMGGGMGMGMGGGGMADEMRVWMALLTNHQKVSRWSRATSYGAEASTTSSDPQIAALIQDHVAQMKALLGRCAAAGAGGAVGACRGPRPWDPLFAAVFANAGDLEPQVANKTTPAGAPLGVFVQERGATPFAAKLAAAHAAAVDGFVARGHDAAMEAHAVPSA
ncbi:MAG: hypothetical protein J3K34DRAFT_438853 [Monoraphidium minutum]|nr:MAG: hypothetical protein J3K34DRAFT_438853 [Monoraphidium minutum]